jgi:hypothetical protein
MISLLACSVPARKINVFQDIDNRFGARAASLYGSGCTEKKMQLRALQTLI